MTKVDIRGDPLAVQLPWLLLGCVQPHLVLMVEVSHNIIKSCLLLSLILHTHNTFSLSGALGSSANLVFFILVYCFQRLD